MLEVCVGAGGGGGGGKWRAKTPGLSTDKVKGGDKHNPGAWPRIPEPHTAESARRAPSLETLPNATLHPPSHKRDSPPFRKAREQKPTPELLKEAY